MGNKAIITKGEIVDVAYEMAMRDGLGSLNMRAVAAKCSISVGTMYHSFATKSDLVNSVVGKFWQESLADIMGEADGAHTSFLAFCRELSVQLRTAFASFRKGFLLHLSTLDEQALESAHAREERAFSHIKRGLERVLMSDPDVHQDRLSGNLAPEVLCALVWGTLLQAAQTDALVDEALFALMEETLY